MKTFLAILLALLVMYHIALFALGLRPLWMEGI